MKIKLSKTKLGLMPPPPDHLYASANNVDVNSEATLQRIKLECEYSGERFSFPIIAHIPTDGSESRNVIRITDGPSMGAPLRKEVSARTFFLFTEDVAPRRGECQLEPIFGEKGAVKKDLRIAYCVARIAEYLKFAYPRDTISLCSESALMREEVVILLRNEIEGASS